MADNRSGDADAESHDDDSDALIDADIDGSLPRHGVDAGQSTPGALLVDAPGEIDLDGTASQGNNERPEGAILPFLIEPSPFTMLTFCPALMVPRVIRPTAIRP